MHNIRPVSDLIDQYEEIEALVHNSGEPVFLTENGDVTLVAMSMEYYSALTGSSGLDIK